MDREPTGAASVLFRLIDLALAKLLKALNVNCRDGVLSLPTALVMVKLNKKKEFVKH